jgi:PTS system mannose-specific IIA component
MTRILLLAHKPLASALREVATHAFPDCAGGIEAIDVDPSATPDTLEVTLRDRIKAGPQEDVLILVDAFGATPCNSAMRVADGVRVRVVAGVNVPMLWRTLCYRTETLSALVERAMAGAVQGVMHVAETRRQNQSSPGGSTPNDQVQHSHQQ